MFEIKYNDKFFFVDRLEITFFSIENFEIIVMKKIKSFRLVHFSKFITRFVFFNIFKYDEKITLTKYVFVINHVDVSKKYKLIENEFSKRYFFVITFFYSLFCMNNAFNNILITFFFDHVISHQKQHFF